MASGFDAQRQVSADNTTNWGNIGGGAGVASETDVIYQGSASVSRKVTTTLKGFYYLGGTARNMNNDPYKVCLFKVNATNYSALVELRLRLGNATGTWHEWTIFDSTTNYPPTGGWQIVPVNPRISLTTSGTSGSPNWAACDYFATQADFTASSKAENLVLDALDFYNGCYVNGGSSGTPETFQTLIDQDENQGTSGRYGGITTREGIIYAYGKVVVGGSLSAGTVTGVSTYFEDSGKTIIFPDGRFHAGYSGLHLDVSANSTTVVDVAGCAFVGRGFSSGYADGTEGSTDDTRPVADFIGPANLDGTGNIDGCLFDNFASIYIDYNFSGVVTFKNCGTVTNKASLGGDSDNLDGSTFTGSPIAATEAQLYVQDNGGAVDLSDMSFVSGGTGHAIEFQASILSTPTINLNSVIFDGYAASDGSTGNETIYIPKTSGTYTINVFGGTVPTIKTDGATVNVVVNPVDLDITVISATTGAVIPSARVRILADTGGDLTAGDVIIEGLTDGSGKISDTRAYTADQPITGRVRKSSVSPYYKTGNVVGTVVSDAGLAITVSLIDDE